MAKIYYDQDADLKYLRGKTLGVIGYGSQGHAHALNLRDNGQKVVVGLYAGSKSAEKAAAEGLTVLPAAEAARVSDVIMILAPDQVQKRLYQESIEPGLRAGKTLMFAHGFNIHFQQVVPPKDVDVSMVAPKSPGHMMRHYFTQGIGVPSLLAIHQDVSGQARQTALAYAKGIGSTQAGVVETTFKEETETDLFGEQTVLCGGISELMKAGFETLVEAGYQPELAYFECLHEMKLIVDLIYQGGLNYMRYSVSDTAEYGDYTRGPRVIDPSVRERMKQILAEIQSGQFAREWIAENESGRVNFDRKRQEEAVQLVETVGKQLREMMQWTKSKAQPTVRSAGQAVEVAGYDPHFEVRFF